MEIKGVILAAGKGVRMLPFTNHFPKPILPICNKPLLQYQIEAMKNIGIEDILIVIGHLGFEIVTAIGNGSRFGINIKYVEQEKTLGIAHAIYKLEQEINSPFLLFLGDIFFRTDKLQQMIESIESDNISAVLATKTEYNKEAIQRNFAVLCDETGYVKRVIEKPKHVSNNLKGCGMYLFSLDIFDALRRTPRTAMRDEYEITDAIQILISDGNKVCHKNIIEEDINLSFPSDLIECNLRELKRLRKDNLIGENCTIADNVRLTNSILGNNVSITHDIEIKNTVVFSNLEIDKSIKKLANTIVTPHQRINC